MRLFLIVIIRKMIVEKLDLRVTEGINEMWQCPGLIDGFLKWTSCENWYHANSQGKGDRFGIASDVILTGIRVATQVSGADWNPVGVANVMGKNWFGKLDFEQSLD